MSNLRRSELEAEFHDARIGDLERGASERRAQSKYYWTTETFDRKLWSAILRFSAGKSVLELGCFSGEKTVKIAAVAASMAAIDISPRAVEHTANRLKVEELHADVRVADAERLPFADASFDVVFGTGIIHHVDVRRIASEIHRVLKPGGHALFREPLGYNPFINLYRKLTPRARTEDEHPLLQADLDILLGLFSLEDSCFFGLSSIISAPLHRFSWGRHVRDALNGLDGLVLRYRKLRKYAWQVNLVMQKAR